MKDTHTKRRDLVEIARRYWESLADFRSHRRRHMRYVFGDQWSDTIVVDGETITEREYFQREGATPLKNNFMSRFLRNVVGVYRSQAKEPTCVARDRREASTGETMSTVLQYNWQVNRMSELLASVMKEFLISGAAIVRKSWGRRNGRTDCWTDIVSPTQFFVDSSMRDIRGWDIRAVGEIRDLSYMDILAEFATGPEDVAQLAEVYGARGTARSLPEFGKGDAEEDFLVPSDSSKCRVIELWLRERKPCYLCHDPLDASLYRVTPEVYESTVKPTNRERADNGTSPIAAKWEMHEEWVYRCLAPDGTVLRETSTPYVHGSHPYVFKFHPLMDGKVHAFMEDMIDQQRYVNRLISLYDWTIRASAKGVLLFPDTSLPKGWSLEDVGREWARYNGIIPIRAHPGTPLPQQITGGGANSGIHDLLGIEMRLMEEISGVNGALQGKPGYSGISASLYAQQTQNATLSLLDLLDAFSDFVVDGAYKDVKNIQQYYSDNRIRCITGTTLTAGSDSESDIAPVRNVEYDLAISESTSTTTYRQLANDYLRELWSAGAITAGQMLRYGDFPYGKQLSDELNRQEKQIIDQQNQDDYD